MTGELETHARRLESERLRPVPPPETRGEAAYRAGHAEQVFMLRRVIGLLADLMLHDRERTTT